MMFFGASSTDNQHMRLYASELNQNRHLNHSRTQTIKTRRQQTFIVLDGGIAQIIIVIIICAGGAPWPFPPKPSQSCAISILGGNPPGCSVQPLLATAVP